MQNKHMGHLEHGILLLEQQPSSSHVPIMTCENVHKVLKHKHIVQVSAGFNHMLFLTRI